MKVMAVNGTDINLIESDFVSSGSSIGKYIRNCLDGFVSYVPDNFLVCYDAILYPVIVSGVASMESDDVGHMFDAGCCACFDSDDALQMTIDTEHSTIIINVSQPAGLERTSLVQFFEYMMVRYPNGMVPGDELMGFISRKALLYRERFGEDYPSEYRGSGPADFVNRVNNCLFYDKKASVIANEQKW